MPDKRTGPAATPGPSQSSSLAAEVPSTVADFTAWRQRRNGQLARQAALDWLDSQNWCACWTTPGRRHWAFMPAHPTGTGAP
jgi:hypothetical protein